MKLYKDGFKTTVELDVAECGQLDAFVVWFDIHVSQERVLTTSPLLITETAGAQGSCQAVCWEQAIFPFLSNHLGHDNGESEDFSSVSIMKLISSLANWFLSPCCNSFP